LVGDQTAALTKERVGLRAGWGIPTKAELFNAEGRLVKTIFTVTGSGYFSTGELPQGIYILRMTDNNDHVANKKILIQR